MFRQIYNYFEGQIRVQLSNEIKIQISHRALICNNNNKKIQLIRATSPKWLLGFVFKQKFSSNIIFSNDLDFKKYI